MDHLVMDLRDQWDQWEHLVIRHLQIVVTDMEEKKEKEDVV
jgi:hypothetical protein